MTTLADFEYLVLTVFRCKPQLVVQAISQLLADKVEVHSADLDIGKVYISRPQSGGALPVTAAIWEPDSVPGAAAFIANSPGGWSNLVKHITRFTGESCCSVRSTVPNANHGIQELALIEAGTITRIVQLLKETRWKFYQAGEPSSIELQLPDSAKAARQVITREYIVSCMARFGFDLTDRQFWNSTAGATYIQEKRWMRNGAARS